MDSDWAWWRMPRVYRILWLATASEKSLARWAIDTATPYSFQLDAAKELSQRLYPHRRLGDML
jgi:hypothetical protein